MPRDVAYWQEFNRRFDPYRVLTQAEVTSLYSARSAPAYLEIVEQIAFASEPREQRVILAGTRGTGKTTELLRARAELDGKALLPVYVDIAAAFRAPTGTLPILVLAAAALRAAGDDWNAPALASTGGADPLLTALKGFDVTAAVLSPVLRSIGAVAAWAQPEAGVAVAAAAGATEALRALGALAYTRLNAPVSDDTRARAEALVDAVCQETARLERASGRMLVLLVDGLDKLTTLDAVDEALADADLLLALPCPIVLSGPMQLRTEPRFASNVLPGRFLAVSLHNVPVVNARTGESLDAGERLLLDLYARRLADAGGEPYRGLIPEEHLRTLARFSSGVIREFLTLVGMVAKQVRRREAPSAEPADVEAALRDRRHALQTTLDSESWSVLERVLDTGELPGGAAAEELLLTNLVACYPNGDVRFRPNELLIDYIEGRRRAREAREGEPGDLA